MRALFVTSTGTDIGKTFVTAGLIRALRGRGMRVTALKPVVSGFDSATAETSDTGVLLSALGRPRNEEEFSRISPWRFAAPLSPDMAARREGRNIDFDLLVNFSRKAVGEDGDALLIEGVGGIMVPLDKKHTVLDWMTALELPLVVVTGSYLGTISHTLSALDVLRRRGLFVAALVVNETPGSTIALDDTIETISRFTPETHIFSLKRTALEAKAILERVSFVVWR